MRDGAGIGSGIETGSDAGNGNRWHGIGGVVGGKSRQRWIVRHRRRRVVVVGDVVVVAIDVVVVVVEIVVVDVVKMIQRLLK